MALFNFKILYFMVTFLFIRSKKLTSIQTMKMRSRLSQTSIFRIIFNWPLVLKDWWKLIMNKVILKQNMMNIMAHMMGDPIMKMRRSVSSVKVCLFALRFLKKQLSFQNLWTTTKLRGGSTLILTFHSTCYRSTIWILIKNIISPSNKEFRYRRKKSDIQTPII